MNYVHLYSNSSGETHFEDLPVPAFHKVAYAPPAPPLYTTDFHPACEHGFIKLEPGWYGDWHPVPRRQIHIYVEGEIEVQSSDGQVRRFGPGTVALAEDTTGKGHITRVVGETAALIFVVALEE